MKYSREIKSIVKRINEYSENYLGIVKEFNECSATDRMLESIIEKAEELKNYHEKRFEIKNKSSNELSR